MRLLSQLHLGFGRRVPVIFQTEASECGLACVAMVLGFHGTVTDLATLRGRHGATPQGMTLVDLVRVAEVERLATRAVRVDLADIPRLRLPCILHWDLGHFVVLSRVRGNRFHIVDPAFGERVLTREQLSPRFSGVALEAWPGSGFEPKQEAQAVSISKLIGHVSGLWPTILRVLSISLALEAFALLSPLFMQWIVDHVIVSRDLNLLSTLGVGFLILILVQELFAFLRSWLVLRVSTQLRVQWRSNVLSHLMRLPLDFFARRHLGDVMSRYGSVGNIQEVLTRTFVESALDGVMVFFALGLMFLYSPALTLIALLSAGIYTLIRVLWYGPLRRATAERVIRSAVESSHLLETIRGIRTIRLFSRHTERLGSWQSLMVSDLNAKLRIQKLEIYYDVARQGLSGVFALVILWVGAMFVIDGELSIGMLLAFLAYRGQFDSRYSALVNQFFNLRMLGIDAQRLADIVLTPIETRTGAVTSRPAKNPPSIELQDVHFRYAEGTPEILSGVNLRIEPGESVAIAGPSGCGKTTLVNLLLGVYTPQQGRILVDGVPLTSRGLDWWRSQIGTVMQDDVLFAGSIAENIAFFDPQMDIERVERCARRAAVHDDIASMPMGYQTLVGDMGTSLSGGQKQRVLLARALYRRPKVLILDEATSHLDLAREAQVGEAIAALAVTRVVVAHRPQTLETVDRVIELGDGKVVGDKSARDYTDGLRPLLRTVNA